MQPWHPRRLRRLRNVEFLGSRSALGNQKIENQKSKIRRIGLFTSGRQDIGYLLPVAKAIAARGDLELTIFLSGTHLLEAYGRTGETFREPGFATIHVPMVVDPDSWDGQVSSFELAHLAGSLAPAMRKKPVDIMVFLGDRIETLCAAVIALAAGRFIAQIHAGDLAPAIMDDANRHAISKLSHVLFAATPSARERLIRMGESPDRVHMVGSPGIDSILGEELPEEAAARKAVGLEAGKDFVVLLYHPSGQDEKKEAKDATAVCQAIADAKLTAVSIEPNMDEGRQIVLGVLRDFSHRHKWPIFPTVDRRIFLRLIQAALALVGNSSSGMIESAAVGSVVLNIGPRQSGREHSANVIDCKADRKTIADWLIRLRDDKELARQYRGANCIFGDGRASVRIAEVLAKMKLSPARRVKLNEY